MTLTRRDYRSAQAAAADEANRHMTANGRTAWSEEDYNVAVATEHKLFWSRFDNEVEACEVAFGRR